jgi:hypothetical protein
MAPIAELIGDHCERYADADPTYAELMACYLDLSLAFGGGDAAACDELVRRSVRLGAQLELESDAAWAVWRARQAR